MGVYIATPTSSTTAAQAAAAKSAGWTPVSSPVKTSGASFSGGSLMPAQGTAAYNALQGQTGQASYDAKTGALTIGGQQIVLPKANQPMDAATLGAQTSLQYPTATPLDVKAPFDAFVEALQVPTEGQGKLEQERGELKKDQLSLMERLLGKSERARDLESQAGINNMMKQLNETNLMLAQRKSAYEQQYLTAENKAIPTPFIIGEQNQIQKTAAVELGALSATAQALQGNLQLAYDTIDRTLKMEYQPVEDALNYTRDLLNMNYQELSREDKKAADKANIILDERNRLLDEEKDLRQWGAKLALEAVKVGAPSSLVEKVMGYKSESQIIDTLSPYLQGVDSMIKITPEDERNLQGAGFTPPEITNIVRDVAIHGIDEVLERLDNEVQKNAVRRVYGVMDASKFLTREFVEGLFTEDALKEAASNAGQRSIWTSWSTERENYLASLMNTIENYRIAGYTDKEIYKELTK